MHVTRLALGIALMTTAHAANVWTAEYDNTRQGANIAETTLTQTNVAGRFGKLGSWAVDGYSFGQPLYIDSATSGISKNILLVATMNNTIYAFNADLPGATIWSVNLGTPKASSDNDLYSSSIGCLSTPVIDTTAKVVYAACNLNTGGWKLFALNLADGTTFHAAVTISGSSGDATFTSSQEIQRPGLLLSNGNVYVAFGSYGDVAPYNGWVFAYNKTTLAQVALWCAAPNGAMAIGAIWIAGGGVAADSDGNLFVATANGDWDGSTNFGESMVKLSPTLSLLDWFTPSDWASMNTQDKDFGGARVMLFGTYAIACDKRGRAWVLNQSALGHLEGGGGNPPIVQEFAARTVAIFAGSLIANNTLYASGTSQVISAYAFSAGMFNTSPTSSSSTFSFPGATCGYSSNGTSGATKLLACVTASTFSASNPVPGTLRIFNATTMAEIYNSNTSPADTLGLMAKFSMPTIIDGRIFVSSFSGNITSFGILPPSSVTGNAVLTGKITLQ